MKFYSGVGSKSTPQDVKDVMYELSFKLGQKGYILRSGGARGADDAFEMGACDVDGDMEIYLPYNKYQGREEDQDNYFVPDNFDNYEKAIKYSRKFHPCFKKLSPAEKKFIVRDTYQVMGRDLHTLSDFVVCWTPDGCITDKQRTKKTGGTGQAISIASYYSLPVFNLKIEVHRKMIKNLI